ncbi:MAG: hypothetical protein HFH93_06800 [Lachnospiraceae bacterium]|nr:hypothetical protein [Lachnospiraceae bacterium]
MKKRVLLALTMAMATAAMFISPALSDAAGLPVMVVSATSNNTQSGNNTTKPSTPGGDTTTKPSTPGGDTTTKPSTPGGDTTTKPTQSGNNTQRPSQPSTPGQSVTNVPTSSGTVVESTVAVDNRFFGVATAVTTPAGELAAAAGLRDGEALIPEFTLSTGEEAKQALTNAAISRGAKMAYAFELNMNLTGRPGVDKVTRLSSPVTFVMAAPADIDGNTYDFAILRAHDGVISVLPDLDNDPATITFATDRFSAYAVIYGEKGTFKTLAQNSAKDSVPKTGDELPVAVPVTVTVCLAAAAMTALALNKRKRA